MAIQDEIPRSRITLTYRTTIAGEPETVKLPLRLLILGDFSLGTSVDRKSDLEARGTRSVNGRNLDDLMKDMNMSLKLEDVKNWIDEGELTVELPITQMKSFHPDEIVKHVPKLNALLLLRKLLVEMQSSIDNRKDLRKSVYELFENDAERKKLADQLKATHKSLVVPGSKAAPAPAPTPTTPTTPTTPPATT